MKIHFEKWMNYLKPKNFNHFTFVCFVDNILYIEYVDTQIHIQFFQNSIVRTAYFKL